MLRTLARRAALLAVPAFLLAPVVVVAGPAQPVQAALTTTTAATVGARAAAPAVATACVSGGPVTAVICGVGAAALIGTGIYLTRDTWMPWFGMSGGSSGSTTQKNESVTISWASDPVEQVVNTNNVITVTVLATNSAGASRPGSLKATSVCRSVSGTFTSVSVVVSQSIQATRTYTNVINTCTLPSTLMTVLVEPANATQAVANTLFYSSPAAGTRVPDNATDDERTRALNNVRSYSFRTEMQCSQGGVTQTIVMESQSAPILPSCTDRLGLDAVPVRADIWGGYDPANIKANPPATLVGQRDALYPDCAVSSCTLYIEYRGARCLEGATGCVRWSEGVIANPADYKCRYGPYTISVDACNPIERLYEPGGATIPATGPNVDGLPATWTPPSTLPSTGTPVITQPQPNPGTGTLPGPGTDPGTGTGGTPGTGTGTGTVTIPGGSLDPDRDPAGFDCFGGSWSFDPVDWVVVPMKCLFIPQTDLKAVHSEISVKAQTKFPFDFVAALSAELGDGIPGQDCPNWRIKVAGVDKNVVCDSSFVDALRSARPLMAGFLVLLAVMPLLRSTLYALVPVINVQPRT